MPPAMDEDASESSVYEAGEQDDERDDQQTADDAATLLAFVIAEGEFAGGFFLLQLAWFRRNARRLGAFFGRRGGGWHC